MAIPYIFPLWTPLMEGASLWQMAGRGLGRDASWDVCLAPWDFVNVAMEKKNTPWFISLWIQPYLPRKCDWGMMTRGLSTF